MSLVCGNPAGSHFWNTKWMRHLAGVLGQTLHFVEFHNCCFGGSRRKLTTLWCNFQELQVLNMLCRPELNHVHRPWGLSQEQGFATQEESAYPAALCAQWAQAVKRQAQAMGHEAVSALSSRTSGAQAARAQLRASLGFLPKAAHMPPLVDPCESTTWVGVPNHVNLSQVIPGRSAEAVHGSKNSIVLGIARHEDSWWAQVGQACEPLEFVRRATKAGHPLQTPPSVPPALEKTCWDIASSLPEVHRHRCQVLHSLGQRALELSKEEATLHSKMCTIHFKGQEVAAFQGASAKHQLP